MISENTAEFYTSAIPGALAKFGLAGDAHVALIKHRENAVYKVEAPSGRSVLRMHRPGYRTMDELWSEAEWTKALAMVGVDTPHHILGLDGEPIQQVATPHGEKVILCDLLDWVDGRQPADDELQSTFEEVGRLSALIHRHSAAWAKPPRFERPRLDEDHLFGAKGVWGDFNRLEALSAEQRALLRRLAASLYADLAGLEKVDANWGLIHADLMPENILQTANGAVVIDFDDGGFGWFVGDLASSLGTYLGTEIIDTLADAWVKGYASVADPERIGLEHLPTFLGGRLLQALGWLHTRKGNETAVAMTDMLVQASCAFADDYLSAN
jgi:Ser/Thr protein kinase RdoA (MazF antagonist)